MTRLETIIVDASVHTIIDIYDATLPHNTLPPDEPSCRDLAAITQLSPAEAGALPFITQKYRSNTHSSFETYAD